MRRRNVDAEVVTVVRALVRVGTPREQFATERRPHTVGLPARQVAAVLRDTDEYGVRGWSMESSLRAEMTRNGLM